MLRRALAAAAVAVLAAGCEGMFGGEEAARIPLQQTAEGGYAPVRILLRPAMNPVAFNLHADFAVGNAGEGGRWNRYRMTLASGGRVIAAREFTVNSPDGGSDPAAPVAAPASLRQLMLLTDLPGEDEYEISITPLQPPVVTLQAPQLVLRINVPPAGR